MAMDNPRARYSELRDIGHKRIQRLEKAGKLNQSALRRYETGIEKIADIDKKYRDMGLSKEEARQRADKEIAQKAKILETNLFSKESGSLSGVQKIEKRREEAIKEERERFARHMADIREQDEADYLDRIWGLTNNIMALLRAYHLDEGFYGIFGSGYTGYDTLSERVAQWEAEGNDVRNKYKAFRDIFGEELSKYDSGVQILEQMKTSSRRRNTKKIRELGDALSAELGGDTRKGRKKRSE